MIIIITALVVFLIKTAICNLLLGTDIFGRFYEAFSFEDDEDQSRLVNTILNVFIPVVTIVVIYYLWIKTGITELDNIYLSIVLYYALRIISIFASGKSFLIDVRWEVKMFTLSFIISYLLYYVYHVEKIALIPDSDEIVVIVWTVIIGVCLVIFKRLMDLTTQMDRESNVREKYVINMTEKFTNLYDDDISRVLEDDYDELAVTVYSILIYENYSRSKIKKMAENIWFTISKVWSNPQMTLGIMQVTTSDMIDDRESVKRGTRLIKWWFNHWQDDEELSQIEYAITKYNNGEMYVKEIESISSYIEMNDLLTRNISEEDYDDCCNDDDYYEEDEIAEYIISELFYYDIARIINALFYSSRYIVTEQNDSILFLDCETNDIKKFCRIDAGDIVDDNCICYSEKLDEISRKDHIIINPRLISEQLQNKYDLMPDEIRRIVPMTQVWTIREG